MKSGNESNKLAFKRFGVAQTVSLVVLFAFALSYALFLCVRGILSFLEPWQRPLQGFVSLGLAVLVAFCAVYGLVLLHRGNERVFSCAMGLGANVALLYLLIYLDLFIKTIGNESALGISTFNAVMAALLIFDCVLFFISSMRSFVGRKLGAGLALAACLGLLAIVLTDLSFGIVNSISQMALLTSSFSVAFACVLLVAALAPIRPLRSKKAFSQKLYEGEPSHYTVQDPNLDERGRLKLAYAKLLSLGAISQEAYDEKIEKLDQGYDYHIKPLSKREEDDHLDTPMA